MRDDCEDIRLAAVNLISQAEITGAEEILAKAREDKSEKVRNAAFDGLDCQDDASKSIVLEKAVKSPFKDVRENVVFALTTNSNRKGVDILIEGMMTDDSDFKEEIQDTLEFLLNRKFATSDEARTWWDENKERYDNDLFEQAES